MNKLLNKTFLIGLLVFVLSISSLTVAFADEHESNEEAVIEIDEERPSLIPGDFFYFVKQSIENIQLALTFDDYKEAQLLAKFAEERIKEANALIAAGDTEGAVETLQKAIEQQEESMATMAAIEDEAKEEDNEEGNEENSIDLDANENENTNEDEDEDADEGTENDGNTDETDESNDDQNSRNNSDAKYTQNIDSLLKAMEKVDNPNAQKALSRNIERSFGQMQKKLDKAEQVQEKKGNRIESKDEELKEEQIKEEEPTSEEQVENVETEEIVQVQTSAEEDKQIEVKPAGQGNQGKGKDNGKGNGNSGQGNGNNGQGESKGKGNGNGNR